MTFTEGFAIGAIKKLFCGTLFGYALLVFDGTSWPDAFLRRKKPRGIGFSGFMRGEQDDALCAAWLGDSLT